MKEILYGDIVQNICLNNNYSDIVRVLEYNNVIHIFNAFTIPKSILWLWLIQVSKRSCYASWFFTYNIELYFLNIWNWFMLRLKSLLRNEFITFMNKIKISFLLYVNLIREIWFVFLLSYQYFVVIFWFFFCQYVDKNRQEMLSKEKSDKTKVLSTRLLSINGSHPPNCINRCDDCTPCKPVIVQVHPPEIPGYYPESWKCNCGNKLYPPQ